ncbi:MAG: ABC transporter ATP-binding protein [Anaerolineae bacterium]|nr:ABC transporter ATP-binding protein [Anaerolineae bacterium]MDW8100918.1 ABC transporter ATP-binding protein [Anaerolineae bacterium]
MNDTIMVAEDLTIGYRHPRGRDYVVARSLSLFLKMGELVCLIGPNGAGKSTLLRTLAGMQPPLAGRVLIDGHDIRALRPRELARRIGMVLTDHVNPGILSSYALVALGRNPYTDWMGRLTAHDEEVVRWALRAVGASALASRNVGELSDGERQKVMIARALAQEPAILILDEPTAFLDLPRRVEVMRILRNLARAMGRAVLLSTHDLDLALRSADRIWLMRPGGTIEIGAPEDLVLNGAFETAFCDEGLEFDRTTGAFKVYSDQKHEISVWGEGITLLWTKRALERAGFRVHEGSSQRPFQVRVYVNGSKPTWVTRILSHEREHNSLYEVVSFLSRANLSEFSN